MTPAACNSARRVSKRSRVRSTRVRSKAIRVVHDADTTQATQSKTARDCVDTKYDAPAARTHANRPKPSLADCDPVHTRGQSPNVACFLPTIATMQRLSDPHLPLLPGGTSLPLISVVIATRNRGAAVVRAIESIVPGQGGGDGNRFELIIVDQSDDDSSEVAVAPYLCCPRIRYHKASSRGLGEARNEGMTIASSEWVAFTDQ